MKELKIYKVVEEYVMAAWSDEGMTWVKSRILYSQKEDDPLAYTYQLSHRTTMGGATGFYSKDYSDSDIQKVRDFLRYHLSLFNMPGAKFEAIEDY